MDSNLSLTVLTAEPKPLLLIRKRHFRTSNEETSSCFIENLLYYCIKSSLYYVEYYEREMDRGSVITCITSFIIQLNLIFTITH